MFIKAMKALKKLESLYLSRLDGLIAFSCEVERIIKAYMAQAGISCIVYSRVKSKESFLEKVTLKQYKSPIKDLKDLVGLRVVVTNPNDLKLVQRILRRKFKVNVRHSINASQRLNQNEVGYRSDHLIVRPSNSIKGMPIIALFQNMEFEIQIRTLLAHAWAEVSHKFYKCEKRSTYNKGSELDRLLVLVAGNLELSDKLIARLWRGAKQRDKQVKREISLGKSTAYLNVLHCIEFLSCNQVEELINLATKHRLEIIRTHKGGKKLFASTILAKIHSLSEFKQIFEAANMNSEIKLLKLKRAFESVDAIAAVTGDFLVGYLIAEHTGVLTNWVKELKLFPKLADALCQLGELEKPLAENS